MLIGAILVLAATLAGDLRPEDEVVLRSGKVLAGHVVYSDAERLVLRTRSREREIARADVESVDCALDALDTLLARLSQLGERDLTGLLDLALYARAHRLPGEAEVLAWSVLAVDPENAEAHGIVGSRRRGERWFVPDGAAAYALDDLLKRRRDFGHAWRFRTTHYELVTNLPMAEAASIALDLERIYAGIYGFLAPELELRDVLEPMKASVHADDASFPEVTGGRRSYFRSETRTLYVNAVGGLDRWTLVHEAVHQVLFATGEGTRRGRAVIPGWLDEGLAEYLAAGSAGEPGRIVVRAGAIADHHFRTHADAGDPYGLSRVLTFSADDFLSSKNVGLKYAQAYTLVHCLLHAEGQRYRAGFVEFLRSCWEGRASTTAFKRCVDVRQHDLERAWAEYVRDNL